MTVYWTAAEIAANVKYPNGNRAFNSAAVARSWLARHRLKAHPSRRGGKTGEAKLYDSDEVLDIWYRGRKTVVTEPAHNAMDPNIRAPKEVPGGRRE